MKKVIITNSKGSQKIANYFSGLIKSDDFLNFVNNNRACNNIPSGGFIERADDNATGILCPPDGGGPEEYSKVKYDKVIDDIENYCKEKKLPHFNFYSEIYDLVMYGKEIDQKKVFMSDLCMIKDTLEPMPTYFDTKFYKRLRAEEDSLFPISIKISPYASLRDIMDFIKKNSKAIKTYQEGHKDKRINLGKYKNKKPEIQERNDFIYKNKDKPRKEIMKLLTDKFPQLDPLDYGHIAKIISLEKQKRKDM